MSSQAIARYLETSWKIQASEHSRVWITTSIRRVLCCSFHLLGISGDYYTTLIWESEVIQSNGPTRTQDIKPIMNRPSQPARPFLPACCSAGYWWAVRTTQKKLHLRPVAFSSISAYYALQDIEIIQAAPVPLSSRDGPGSSPTLSP